MLLPCECDAVSGGDHGVGTSSLSVPTTDTVVIHKQNPEAELLCGANDWQTERSGDRSVTTLSKIHLAISLYL